jgi:hypothetical protein
MLNEADIPKLEQLTNSTTIKNLGYIVAIVTPTIAIVMGYMALVNRVELVAQQVQAVAKDVQEIKGNHLVHVENKLNEFQTSLIDHDKKIERILTILKQ